MIDNLIKEIEEKYNQLNEELTAPGVHDDRQHYADLAKAHSDLQPAYNLVMQYREAIERLAEEIRVSMLEADPNDDKDVIIEIRGGAGGDEASLFAGELLRMYAKHAENKGFKTEILSSSPTEMGGFKEVIMEVAGKGAYSVFKYESGVHRVQRIPVTESGGRIHTSTSTVAVLPEVEEVELSLIHISEPT